MDGRFETWIRPDRGFAAWPTHDDSAVVIGGWPYSELQANKGDIEGNYLAMLELAPAFAERVRAATRQARLVGTAVRNYFGKPFGPGWALVGDAGYNKDFITAQGMQDAFRDAEVRHRPSEGHDPARRPGRAPPPRCAGPDGPLQQPGPERWHGRRCYRLPMIGSWVLGFREAAAMTMPDQRRRVVVVVALGVVVVTVGLAVPVARGLLEDEPAAPVTTSGGGPWERLPRPPANDIFQGPELGSAVWTGEELLLLADSAFTPPPSMGPPDALAYDPATGGWRVLPEPPLRPDEDGGGVPVWTGTELLLVSRTGSPLAYDPDADRWRRFTAPPPGLISGAGAPEPVWTGAEVLLWDFWDGGPGAAYNPATDRWRQLTPPPLGRRRTWTIQAWTGRQLLVVGGTCGSGVDDLCRDGAAYDPAADTWTPVPGLAGGAIAPEAASAWTGSELVVWSTTADKAGRSVANTASAYDPGAGRWRALPPAPITPRRLAALVWAGDRLLVWGGIRNLPGDRLAYPDDGAAYDPRRERWQRLARAPVPGRASPLTAWTGDRAIFIGGMNVGDRLRMDRGNIAGITEQGAAWRPR
jgi:hypothetical protein